MSRVRDHLRLAESRKIHQIRSLFGVLTVRFTRPSRIVSFLAISTHPNRIALRSRAEMSDVIIAS